MVFWLSGCVCCVMFYYSMRSCVRSQPMYFFSSNNNYVIQKYALSPEGMFANTRFSREQCWQTLLFVLRENVCKYLTQTIVGYLITWYTLVVVRCYYCSFPLPSSSPLPITRHYSIIIPNHSSYHSPAIPFACCHRCSLPIIVIIVPPVIHPTSSCS
jgi:hypothetical protein